MEKIRLAHSPDSDDAFMFYALATGKVETGGFEFVHHLADIETLNRAAVEGKYEVTAISIHAYAHLQHLYTLMNVGASMGDGYGPVVVSKRALVPGELKGRVIAIPGKWTSAYLALRILEPDFSERVLPFDQIIPAVASGTVDAGVVIHEGQLSYRVKGLSKVIDLGEWWKDETKLPLPLGGNVVRKDLGKKKGRRISALVAESIRYALEHREEALEYALQFGRGLDVSQGDQFVSMYVNNRTLDYGKDGREAVQLFLDRGFEIGILPAKTQVAFL